MEVLADLKAPPPLGPADVLLSVRFVCRDGRTGLNTWEFTMWGNVDLVATVSRSSKAMPWEETHRGCRARVEGVWPYPENWVHQVFATAGTEYEVVARREDRDAAQPSGRYVLAPMATVVPEAEGAQLLPGSFGLPPRLAVLQASVGSGSVEWVAPTELEVHVVEEAPWLFAGIFEVTRKGLARVLSVIAASGYRLAVATPEGRYTFVAPAEPELRPKSSDWDMDIESLPRLLDRRRTGDAARKRGGAGSGTEDPACSTSEGSSVSHETFQSEKVRTDLCRDSSSTALSGRSTKSERLCPKAEDTSRAENTNEVLTLRAEVLRLMSTKAACDRESERAVAERDEFRELVRAQGSQKEKVVDTQDSTATLIARIRELERALREAEAERVRHAEARRQADEAHAEESTRLRALVAQLEEQVSTMPPWPAVRTRDMCNAVEASRHILIDCPGVNEDDIDISGLPNGVRVRIERSEAGTLQTMDREFHYDYRKDGCFELRMDECALERGVLELVLRRTPPQRMKLRRSEKHVQKFTTGGCTGGSPTAFSGAILVNPTFDGFDAKPRGMSTRPEVFMLTPARTADCSVASEIESHQWFQVGELGSSAKCGAWNDLVPPTKSNHGSVLS
uniref:SHSP domain-containing protein n=1 Tax=Noctiluca scintillans TaxID=2966 RepID=A0A7S0ZSZ1_NOCSC